MNVLGWALIGIGIFYCFGRILNQGEMYRMYLRASSKSGILKGLENYFFMEIIIGFGLGTFLLTLGYYLVYDYVPLRLIFSLFAILFYVLSFQVSFINIREVKPITLNLFQIRNPFLASILPIGHPFFLIIAYLIFGYLAYMN
jgi:hypothetical protein